MKKQILLSALVSSVVTVGAQQINISNSFDVAQPAHCAQKKDQSSVTPMAPLDTIFYEGFGNGLPGTGSNGAWSAVDNSGTCNWKYTKKSPQGQYSTNVSALKSISAANGFMILDGDSANTPVQWFGSGQPGGTYGVTSNPLDADLISPSINCSAYPDVILSLQHAFRYCCNTGTNKIELWVSGDGGANWTLFDIKKGLSANKSTANATKAEFNISAVAGGKSNVKVKFHKSVASHYYWMIDDVLLYQAPDHDVQLERPFVDLTASGRYGFYNQTPLVQVCPATFQGAVYNFGVNNETNVRLNVNINSGVYNQTNTGITLNKTMRDTLKLLTPVFTPPQTQATYSVAFNVTQALADDVPANNIGNLSFKVTDTVFARDNDFIYPRMSATGPQGWVGGDVDGCRWGTTYGFMEKAEMNSMSVYVDSLTAIGTGFKGVVFRFDAVAGNIGSKILETAPYDINTAADRKKWVTLPFLGKDGINDIGDVDSSVIVAVEVSGVAAGVSVYVGNDAYTYHNGDLVSLVYLAGNSTWFYVDYNPFIRLNVASGHLGMNEAASANFNLLQNTPNPAKDFTAVQYQLKESSKVSMKIYDVAGKEIMSFEEGTKNPGVHKIQVNTSDLTSGVYYYTFTSGGQSQTRKMVVVD